MLRSVLGVLVGAVSWLVGFYALAIGLARLWPEYAIHGRQWFKEAVFTFTPPMAACNVVLWILAAIAAGWVAGKISKRPVAVGVLAALIGIYLSAVHLVLYWPRFPGWYNLGVAIPAVPAVLLGGYLAKPSAAKSDYSAKLAAQ